ncbi:hypothetical protein [Leifsonia aquatica]|uniref:hypothetical protein n=1 Tax=Leifsonia aquatica TaxID=144185 RepID=UPI0028AC910B|nr:hypothetical protein [Leifsonia aquatica]
MDDKIERDHLTQAMPVLDRGLNQIAQHYAEDVSLLDEDPETFGAGHYVLYPAGHTRARFAIEEQYAAGTDWSDPDRVPTSWLWRAERIALRNDGHYAWALEDHVESFPEDLPQLLAQVEKWARKVRAQNSQSRAFERPDIGPRTRPMGPSL